MITYINMIPTAPSRKLIESSSFIITHKSSTPVSCSVVENMRFLKTESICTVFIQNWSSETISPIETNKQTNKQTQNWKIMLHFLSPTERHMKCLVI